MSRFRCADCGQRSTCIIGCHRCNAASGRRIALCPLHGGHCRPNCRMCRVRFRAQSHA